MNTVIRYQCEYCLKKVYQNKSSARKHEKNCWWNPDIKACMTCANYLSPNDSTQFQVIDGDNTVCAYANPSTGFNSKCKGWVVLQEE